MTLFEGNLPQNDRERERNKKNEKTNKKKRERKKERERASWMPNAMVTAGNRAPQVEFPHRFCPARSVNVHNSIRLVYAKFNGLSCMAGTRLSLLGGPYRFTGFRAHL